MIIGMTGKKQAGKDTVGKYLVENYNFTRISFADKMKESVCALFNISIEQVEAWKNDPSVSVVIQRETSEELPPLTLKSITFRELLKFYGTEAHRDIFWPDIWIDVMVESSEYLQNENVVVTDVRFRNEAEWIIHQGGKIVLVDRPFYSMRSDKHRSEAGIPNEYIDYTLHNVGDINDLHRAVDAFMEEVAYDSTNPSRS